MPLASEALMGEKTIDRLFRSTVPLALCTIVAGMVFGANKASFRIVAYLNEYNQPGGLMEGSPGVFYSLAGSPSVAFSVTTRGLQTVLAKFPTGYLFQVAASEWS